jgi:hypothetical protein
MADLETIVRHYKMVTDIGSGQREREREALNFQVSGNQWSADAKKERSGQEGVPARPMLSISKLDQPIQLVLNQARAAQLGVTIQPVSEKATSETAEVMQGIYRRIERDSNANQARLWALDRAIKCGRGAYRVNVKWDDDAPDTFDQEITIERILHQDAVHFDPSAQKPDYSDGDWCFVAGVMSLEKFRREFPKAALTKLDDKEFWDAVSVLPEWVQGTGDNRGVVVAEYWYKEHRIEKFVAGPKGRQRERERDIVTVKCCKVTGTEILDEQDWDGKYIPIIPVVGRELQPFDHERRYVGMIEPAMDGQRLYNYAASTLVERMAMEPKTPFLGFVGQFATDDAKWKTINNRNHPYVEADLVTVDGKAAPIPQRAQLDQTGMSLAMMALQESDNFIQSTTSVYDPSLGRDNPRDKSGKAILALQQQGDAGTSHFLAGMADISMPYEAVVVLDLMPSKYDRAGRVTQILGEEDDTRAVMLNQPFVMDQGTKIPRPAQPNEEGAKLYNLREGRYAISVSIGKSFQTRLQEGGDMLGQILQSQPELMPLIGATFFQFQPWPGAKELSKILKKVRDKQFPHLADDEEGSPEQLQAKLEAMQAQLQEAQGALQQAIQQLETDAAKQQATLTKAKLDNEAKLAVAQIQQQEKTQADELKVVLERMEQRFEEIQKALDRAHEMQIHREEMAHEVAMAAAGGNTMTRTYEGGQEQGQEREDESSQGSTKERSREASDEESSAPEGE